MSSATLSHPLAVRYAIEEHEKLEAVRFATELYKARFNTVPPPVAAYAIIHRNGSIAACMGVAFAHEDGSYQIERAYRIRRAELADIPISASNCAQLSNWASTDQEAGMAATYGAVWYALRMGRIYAYVEHDKIVHRHCIRHLGVKFWNVRHSGVDLSAVPPENQEFFAKNTMEPYIVDLAQMRQALAERIAVPVIPE